MKHLFIINPASGNGKTHKKLIDNIHKVCGKLGADYDIRMTEHPGHATLIVKNELLKTDEKIRFYACGGDGTVNETASALLGISRAELSVIPVGTGNDFVRSFPKECDFLCLEKQILGESTNVDIVSCGKHTFVNALNSGFDSAVVETIAKLRDKTGIMRGKFAYVIGVVLNLFKMPCVELECKLDDGEIIKGKFLLSAFSNGRYYGGGFQVASKAELDDGELDVLFVKPCSRLTFLSLVPSYKKGTIYENKLAQKYIIYKKCSRARLRLLSDIAVCIDGELTGDREFDIEVQRKALSLSLPEGEKNENN